MTILTVPHFLNNLQDKEFLTASKRINYLVSQAVGQLNVSSGITAATSPEDFVNNYLSKVMKFTKVCGYSNHSDCGFTSKIYDVAKNKINLSNLSNNLSGGEKTWNNSNTNGYSFVSLNGYSMMLFYNQNCLEDVTNAEHYVQDRVCINIVWDINGNKSPNQVSKDIGFTTVFYPINSKIVTPVVASTSTSGLFYGVNIQCQKYGKDYKAPSREELASMFINSTLIAREYGCYWSSSSASNTLGWVQNFFTGNSYPDTKGHGIAIRCIKNNVLMLFLF